MWLRRSVCPARMNFPSVAHFVATGAARRFGNCGWKRRPCSPLGTYVAKVPSGISLGPL
jgi:hypothetical protein